MTSQKKFLQMVEKNYPEWIPGFKAQQNNIPKLLDALARDMFLNGPRDQTLMKIVKKQMKTLDTQGRLEFSQECEELTPLDSIFTENNLKKPSVAPKQVKTLSNKSEIYTCPTIGCSNVRTQPNDPCGDCAAWKRTSRT